MGLLVVSILLIILVVFLLVVLFLRHQRAKGDIKAKTIKFFQFNSNFTNLENSEKPTSPFTEIIRANNYSPSKTFSDANLIMFTDYSYIDQNLRNVSFKQGTTYYIYGINGSDNMANKAYLADNLRSNGYHAFIPRSFTLDNKDDLEELKQQHTDESLYIIKKNIQRQEGNLITKDIDYIVNKASSENYVVCQELLQNPFLVNGRKINLRVYLLVVIKDRKTHFYIYHDGFMYYTPKHWEKGSIERDVNITTGYIDRKVYEENPLTHKDFYEYLDENQALLFKQNMIVMFRALKDTYTNILVKENADIPGTKFNIFGCDVAPDDKLNTVLIEINKGPDLSYKDERDKNVKLTMVTDCFALVGLSHTGDPKNFLRI